MPAAPFGNDPAKIARYRAFWNRDDVRRPLVGFSLAGWFSLAEFQAREAWGEAAHLTPEMVAPEAFLPDHLRLLAEGEVIDDDMIRGACPAQVAIPWLSGALGCRVRILPDNLLGEERRLSWDEAMRVQFDPGHPWFRKYTEFAALLVRVAGGRFPVSHSPLSGPTDLHADLRGHNESVLDLVDEPERSAELLSRMGEICRQATEEIWKRLPLFHGGYFDAQYSLWAPGPIIRMQEDATALYSPALYRRFVQPVDRRLAGHFASAFIHLHSTSMFLLEEFLEIDEIRCYEVNNDVGGPPLREMVPCFERIQAAGKPLLIRGSFTTDELRLLVDSLDPRGLFLYIMIDDLRQMEPLRPLVGM
jgi:hypothetical protein